MAVRPTNDDTGSGAGTSFGRSPVDLCAATAAVGQHARIVLDRSRAKLIISGEFGRLCANGLAAIGAELLRMQCITALLVDLSAVTAIDADGLAALSRWSDVGRLLRKPTRLCATSAAVRTALDAQA
jgi:ABC-type transporter Mla MlaB component